MSERVRDFQEIAPASTRALVNLIRTAQDKLSLIDQPTNPKAPERLQEWKYIGQVPQTMEVVIVRCQGARDARHYSGLFVDLYNLEKETSRPIFSVQLPKHKRLIQIELTRPLPDSHTSKEISEVADKIKKSTRLSEEGYQNLLFTAMSPVS